MARRLFTILSAVSFMLCVATLVLWARSPRARDGVTYQSAAASYTLVTGPNRLELRLTELPGTHLGWITSTTPRETPARRIRWMPPGQEWLGFGWEAKSPGPSVRYWRLVSRFWFLTAAFACLPALALSRVIRARSDPSNNRCPACGYDLRATPARCLECGKVAGKGVA